MTRPKITIVPAPNCRRSKKVLDFLAEHRIPFDEFRLESHEGQHFQEKYQFRASPGILVNGVSINPYDILLQPQCRVDTEKALEVFTSALRSRG